MVAVTSRLTTGVTETAGGGEVPWAEATLHDTAIMSAQKVASEAGEADIEVLLAASVSAEDTPIYGNTAEDRVAASSPTVCVRRRYFGAQVLIMVLSATGLVEPTHRKYAQDLSWLNMFRLTSSQGLRRRSGALSLAHGLTMR